MSAIQHGNCRRQDNKLIAKLPETRAGGAPSSDVLSPSERRATDNFFTSMRFLQFKKTCADPDEDPATVYWAWVLADPTPKGVRKFMADMDIDADRLLGAPKAALDLAYLSTQMKYVHVNFLDGHPLGPLASQFCIDSADSKELRCRLGHAFLVHAAGVTNTVPCNNCEEDFERGFGKFGDKHRRTQFGFYGCRSLVKGDFAVSGGACANSILRGKPETCVFHNEHQLFPVSRPLRCDGHLELPVYLQPTLDEPLEPGVYKYNSDGKGQREAVRVAPLSKVVELLCAGNEERQLIVGPGVMARSDCSGWVPSEGLHGTSRFLGSFPLYR